MATELPASPVRSVRGAGEEKSYDWVLEFEWRAIASLPKGQALLALAGVRMGSFALFVLYCIVLYCIVLYCIVLYCILLCCYATTHTWGRSACRRDRAWEGVWRVGGCAGRGRACGAWESAWRVGARGGRA